jgi:cardiolipin synthase
MTLRWLPNALTVGRMVLAAPVLWALQAGRFRLAFWLAVAAGISDALDGFLARRNDWRTPSGGLLDPLADKLLLGTCFVGLWWVQPPHLPGWLVALVLLRDVVILGGAAAWWATLGPFAAEPSKLSKLNTLLQLALVAAVLGDAAFAGHVPAGAGRNGAGPVPLVWLQALMLACAGLTVASGVDYVVRWGARYAIALRNRP